MGGLRMAIQATLLLGVGFFAGRQSKAINLVINSLAPLPLDAPLVQSDAVSSSSSSSLSSGAIRLHKRVEIGENAQLFGKLFRQKVEVVLKDGGASCPTSDVKPYLDILKNLADNPRHYEDENVEGDVCPLVFLFYYEDGTQILQRWVDFYHNIDSKRCIKFIAPRRYRNTTDTNRLAEMGYELVGPVAVKQDKVINLALDRLQKERYGSDVLVSVNDLDHLLVWFGAAEGAPDDGGPYRYSTYSDMLLLYVLELLSTEGCSNQHMVERFVVPCTCMLEDNQRYVANDEVIFSEYGKNNKFHPTSNFYVKSRPPSVNPNDWTTGTMYANLRGFHQNAITHHIIGTHKKIRSEARHVGVLHYRSGSYLSDTTKYMHFLVNNGWLSNRQATVDDILFCATAKPAELFVDHKRCRGVKEIANIIANVHQKRLCLAAGFDEEHCMAELTCCVSDRGELG